jgi:hypothetical protein
MGGFSLVYLFDIALLVFSNRWFTLYLFSKLLYQAIFVTLRNKALETGNDCCRLNE